MVHEVELQVRDISADLPVIFEAFYVDESARTCPSCGHLHPGKG
jgi:3-hydroxyanthranilate 3,4-dioxygenase